MDDECSTRSNEAAANQDSCSPQSCCSRSNTTQSDSWRGGARRMCPHPGQPAAWLQPPRRDVAQTHLEGRGDAEQRAGLLEDALHQARLSPLALESVSVSHRARWARHARRPEQRAAEGMGQSHAGQDKVVMAEGTAANTCTLSRRTPPKLPTERRCRKGALWVMCVGSHVSCRPRVTSKAAPALISGSQSVWVKAEQSEDQM